MTQGDALYFQKLLLVIIKALVKSPLLFASSEACCPKPRADGMCFPWMNHGARWGLRCWTVWYSLFMRLLWSHSKHFETHNLFYFLQTLEEPPYLTVGTDVSAKYRGAFCEAKIKTAKRLVKAKVSCVLKNAHEAKWQIICLLCVRCYQWAHTFVSRSSAVFVRSKKICNM